MSVVHLAGSRADHPAAAGRYLYLAVGSPGNIAVFVDKINLGKYKIRFASLSGGVGNYSSEQEFKEAWTEEFPNEIEWYHFSAVEDEEEGFWTIVNKVDKQNHEKNKFSA